jgi:hypothetical protein
MAEPTNMDIDSANGVQISQQPNSAPASNTALNTNAAPNTNAASPFDFEDDPSESAPNTFHISELETETELNVMKKDVSNLFAQADKLIATLDSSQRETQVIYAAYQTLKLKLIQTLADHARQLQDVHDGYSGDTRALDRTRVSLRDTIISLRGMRDQLQNIIAKIESTVLSFESTRKLFNVDEDDLLANYYGVYAYNLMMNAKTGSNSAQTIEQIYTNLQSQNAAYQDLVDELPPSDLKRKESKSIQSQINMLDKAKQAVDEISVEENSVDEKGQDYDILADVMLSSANHEVAINETFPAMEIAPQPPEHHADSIHMDGIANWRMYETDTPNKSVPNGAIGSKDVAWRKFQWHKKKAAITQIIGQSNYIVDSAGIPTIDTLKRTLSKLFENMHLTVHQYAPSNSPRKLTKNATKQMRMACGQSDNNLQKVIPLNVWQEQLLNVIEGKFTAVDGTLGWVALDQENNIHGIIHCRDSKKIQEVFQLAARIKVNNQSAAVKVPAVRFPVLDITFLCAGKTNMIRNLGTLLMLHALVEQFADFKDGGTMLDVVAAEPGSEEGFSQGKANTDVAAYYLRYFKYQRTFLGTALANSTSKGYFAGQPPYIVNTKRNEPLYLMYRSYPTLVDLSHMVARLCHDYYLNVRAIQQSN